MAKDRPIKQVLVSNVFKVYMALVLLSMVIVGRIVYVQTAQGDFWKSQIKRTKLKKDKIPATRGNIYADNGSLLATTVAEYKLIFDPNVADHSIGNGKLFWKNSDSLYMALSKIFKIKSAGAFKAEIMEARGWTMPDTNRKSFLAKNKAAIDKKKKEMIAKAKRDPKNKDGIILVQQINLDVYDNLNLGHRRITYKEKEQLSKLQFIKKGAYKSGLIFQKVDVREHPFDNMALRTLGNFDEENGANRGLEESMDQHLKGTPGVGLFEVLKGNVKKPVEDLPETKPISGKDIYTTINVNIQDETEAALRKAVEKYRPNYATAIVMEVKTGEIKAIANLGLDKNGEKYVETENFAIGYATQPGSTFKLPSMLALLEEGVQPTDSVETGNGLMPYKNKVLTDSHRGGFGRLSVQQVFEKSSNIGVVKLILDKFGSQPRKYYEYLEKFKLREKIGFQMKGEPTPTFYTPDSKYYSAFSLPYTSFGGIEARITPLQMLTFYNAIANDGYWVEPIIVKEVKEADKTIINMVERQRKIAQPIASAASIKKIKIMMEGVVERGTARFQKTDQYKFAGKTGTCRKLKNGAFKEGIFYTAFAGYFPADAPRYSCIIIIDEPKGQNAESLYAGDVAAPVFRQIADHIFADDLGLVQNKEIAAVQPSKLKTVGLANESEALSHKNEDWLTHKSKQIVVNPNQKPQKTAMPNLLGLSLKDALYVLENRNLKVKYNGMGKVTSQSVVPGSMTNQSSVVSLTLL